MILIMIFWHVNPLLGNAHSTYQVFGSHVKSSQVDFLYSSVLLKLTACSSSSLLAPSYSEFCSLMKTQHGHVSQKTHITWRLPTQFIGALAAVYRKHMSRVSYLLLWWRHCTCAEVCLPSRCLETGCVTPLICCCVLDRVCLHVTICNLEEGSCDITDWPVLRSSSAGTEGKKLKQLCLYLIQRFMAGRVTRTCGSTDIRISSFHA
jgi:hypothetical protein